MPSFSQTQPQFCAFHRRDREIVWMDNVQQITDIALAGKRAQVYKIATCYIEIYEGEGYK